MKVVINKGFGSFCLTNEQFERVLELKGIEFDTKTSEFDWVDYFIKGTDQPLDFDVWDIDRSDPELVQMVSESEHVVDDWSDGLKVVEIPDGISWQIDDYDGNEWVSETHRTWG